MYILHSCDSDFKDLTRVEEISVRKISHPICLQYLPLVMGTTLLNKKCI